MSFGASSTVYRPSYLSLGNSISECVCEGTTLILSCYHVNSHISLIVLNPSAPLTRTFMCSVFLLSSVPSLEISNLSHETFHMKDRLSSAVCFWYTHVVSEVVQMLLMNDTYSSLSEKLTTLALSLGKATVSSVTWSSFKSSCTGYLNSSTV